MTTKDKSWIQELYAKDRVSKRVSSKLEASKRESTQFEELASRLMKKEKKEKKPRTTAADSADEESQLGFIDYRNCSQKAIDLIA